MRSAALTEIRDAEDRAHAEAAITVFADAFAAKWPKAVAKIVDDTEVLLMFFVFHPPENHQPDRVPISPQTSS